MNNIEELTQLAIKAIEMCSKKGQTMTKHDVLNMMKEINPSTKDGYAVGRAIFNLVVNGFLELIDKKGNANVYKRIK